MRKRWIGMCKYFLIACLLILTPGFVQPQTASSQANRGTATVTLNGKTVSINYGRPQLRGRDVMAMAAPGTVWRMGMNEATELNTALTLKFKGLTVQPGKYTLFAKKVSDHEWNLIVNKKTGQWGTEYDASQDLGMTQMSISDLKEPVEMMGILLSARGKEGVLELSWGARKLSANFSVE